MNPHETLQELQKQLSRLSPAVTLSEEAVGIARTCKKIADEATELLSKFEQLSTDSIVAVKEEASASLTAVTGQNRLAIKEVENSLQSHLTALTTMLNALADEASQAVETSKKTHEDHIVAVKNQLNSFVQNVENKLQSELGNLKETVETEILEYKKLVASSEKLISKIDTIDFPQRLDKVDANVTGINLGIQNVQTRIENLERNLKDEIKENRAAIVEFRNNMEQFTKKQVSTQMWLLILLIINGLTGIGILLFIILK